MNYLFPPGSSQDGEGEADESMEDVDASHDLLLEPIHPMEPIHSQPAKDEDHQSIFTNGIDQAAPFVDPAFLAPISLENGVLDGNINPHLPADYNPYPSPATLSSVPTLVQDAPAPLYEAPTDEVAPPSAAESRPELASGLDGQRSASRGHDDEPDQVDENGISIGRPKRKRSERDIFSASAGPSDAGSKGKGKERETDPAGAPSQPVDAPRTGKKKKKKSNNPSGGPKGGRKPKIPPRSVMPDPDCSFCLGDDTDNKTYGGPEKMVSCYNCGRAGHPRCLQMGSSTELIQTIMNYNWHCIECKTCEICHVQGDDETLLFCDKCDRGTHLECTDPPLSEPPAGTWDCGKCAALPPPPPPSARGPGRPPHPASHHRQPSRPSSSRRPAEEATPVASSSKRVGSRPSYRPDPVDSEDDDFAPVHRRIKLKVGYVADSSESDDDDDPTSKLPFGGVLTEEEADTSRSRIASDDKSRFEKSMKAAEAKLGGPRPASLEPYASMPSTPQAVGSPSSSGSFFPATNGEPSGSNRPLRDQLLSSQVQDHARAQPSTPGPSGSGSGSMNGSGPSAFEKIKCIRFGQFEIDTWYTAPFPEEYAVVPDGRLWICEFCLKYMKSAFGAGRHRLKCKARHPPGEEVYRDGAVSVFEVDGRKNKIYCQNLCLLAKMFLDHKTLYYDVEPFLFYIMTETDEYGARFVGYFSKEKRSPMNYNVSCIMTLPVRQRKGWGNLLIDFSYLLSKKEKRVGSPEKPLSDLGLLSYSNYWTVTLFFYLRTAESPVTVEDISHATSLTAEDIIFALKKRNMITVTESAPLLDMDPKLSAIKNGKARGPAASHAQAVQTAEAARVSQASYIPESYTIEWDRQEVEDYLVRFEAKGWLQLRPKQLKWSPFIMDRAVVKKVVSMEGEGANSLLAIEGVAPAGTEVVSASDGAKLDGESAADVGAEASTAENATVDKIAELQAEDSPPTPSQPPAQAIDANADAGPSHSAMDGVVEEPASVVIPTPTAIPSILEPEPQSELRPFEKDIRPSPIPAPPPPAAPPSPARARRSQPPPSPSFLSALATPPPPRRSPSPAHTPPPPSLPDEAASVAVVTALASPNRRLRSSVPPTSPNKRHAIPVGVELPEQASPGKRLRNGSVESGGAGLALGPIEPEQAAEDTKGVRGSPRKGVVAELVQEVHEV